VNLAGAAIVAAVVLAAPAARAETGADWLAQARRQKQSLQYAAALDSLERALEAGDNGPAAVAEIHRLAGEMAAGLGRPSEATDRFTRWLALRPDARLAPGTSPKLTGPFDAARAFFADHRPLIVRAEVDAAAHTASVLVDSDPLSMVAGARFECRGPDGERRVRVARGGARLTVALPRWPRVEITVTVVDRDGNAIAVAGGADAPLVARAPEESAGPAPPLWARPVPWTLVGAGFAAVGVYFGLAERDDEAELRALNAASTSHEATDALDLADRGRRHARLANASFAVAGLAGAAAAALWLWGPGQESGRAVAVTAGGDHVAVAVAMSF
jgi:tetratricopeptide (TPR) repeat protein